jgi:uncharacterized protein YndB with AHSA1/START domain
MAKSSQTTYPPITRSIAVSWNQEDAFRRFTADFAKWWPSFALSVGGPRVKEIVFECRAGGQIYEEHTDGTRFLWGTITAWDAPRSLSFSWHPSRDPVDSQDVEVSFTAEPTGTRVQLVSSGWERLGEEARRGYDGYRMGWGTVLSKYAERFSAQLLLFNSFSAAINLIGQRDKHVRRSLGRMPHD